MRSTIIFVTFLAITSTAVAEPSLIGAGLVLGGLAALKGAALVGYAVGKHKGHYLGYYGRYHGHYAPRYHSGYYYKGHYGKRSVEDQPTDEGEDLLLSTVGRLDPKGCVLKLLCQLQFKDEAVRTVEENNLVDMFSNGTETLTAFNAAFVYATDVGIKNQDPYVCKKYFPNCPLNEDQLRGLLQQAWGCGINFFAMETGNDEVTADVNEDAQPQVPLEEEQPPPAETPEAVIRENANTAVQTE